MANNSIDGFFIPRREQHRVNGGNNDRPSLNVDHAKAAQTALSHGGVRLSQRHTAQGQGKDSLPAPGLPPPSLHAPRGRGRKSGRIVGGKKGWKFRKPSRKTVKKIAIIAAILLLIVGGYFVYRFVTTSGKVFKGNVFNAIFSDSKPLKEDANGRTNVLLFGTSEDDPKHGGADLTDSIMVASINQKKKDVFLTSIPRDLYVKYGRACTSGYEGKINEVYLCGRGANKDNEDAGQEALRKKVADVLGLDVQYSAHVNYTVLREAVNAVGGVQVTIDSEDPRGILDRNFDWRCNYKCFYVKYKNGPVNLDGEHALALARARGSVAPTYGLGNGNFDREKYQQKILIALKDKASSAGTLANPVALDKLISALGDNVRTTFDAQEVKTVAKIARETKTNNIKSLPLSDPEDPLMTTGMAGGMSIVRPTKGLNDYSDIKSRVRAYATGDTALLEKAKVDVLNASGVAGAAQTQADKVTNGGLLVEVIGNAPESLNNGAMQVYDLSGGKKPGTKKKLETLFKTKASTTPPAGVTSNSDFVIIVGSDGAS